MIRDANPGALWKTEGESLKVNRIKADEPCCCGAVTVSTGSGKGGNIFGVKEGRKAGILWLLFPMELRPLDGATQKLSTCLGHRI